MTRNLHANGTFKEKKEKILKDSGFGVVKGDLMVIYYFPEQSECGSCAIS